jgi:hypothetical protein
MLYAMKADPVGFCILVTCFVALVSTGVLFGIHSWWFEMSYSDFKVIVFLASIVSGVAAFLVRRHTGG